MTKTKLFIIALIISFILVKYLHYDRIQENQEQYNQEVAKQAQCGEDNPPQRIVQFDYSYIRKTHKEHLVRDYFDEKPCEWIVRDFDMAKKFDLVWVFGPHQIQYNRIKEGKQMANHIENLQRLVDKSLMVNTLKKFDENSNNPFKNVIKSNEFLPKTYTIDLDKKNFNTQEHKFFDDDEEGIWIQKPTNQFGGRGIGIVQNIKQFKTQVENKKKQAKQGQGKIVIQKYIEDPFLIENKKFDIRTYVFIASVKPKYLALFHKGFIRRTLFEYTEKSKKSTDLNIHLTNIENQRLHPNFEKLSDSLMMSVEDFESYMLNQGGLSQEQLDKINDQIKLISSYTVQAAQQQLTNKKGYFQVLGFDFMLDKDLNVYLIEINKSPSWQILNPRQNFKKKMLFRFIDTVMDVHENEQAAAEKVEQNLSDTDFDVIYNEYTNKMYQSKYIQDKSKKREDL